MKRKQNLLVLLYLFVHYTYYVFSHLRLCVFFHKKEKEKMYRHCHLSLCENKIKNVHFWRMMQLEILNHHCFVCIKEKKEEKEKEKI
jgi:hypothetical protein